jgi:hypothetical protein
MQVRKLLTLSFDRNVGTLDRIARISLGAALAALPWLIAMPHGFTYAAVIVGAMIALSGLLARCSIYYLLGYRTCPISGKASPFRS